MNLLPNQRAQLDVPIFMRMATVRKKFSFRIERIFDAFIGNTVRKWYIFIAFGTEIDASYMQGHYFGAPPSSKKPIASAAEMKWNENSLTSLVRIKQINYPN